MNKVPSSPLRTIPKSATGRAAPHYAERRKHARISVQTDVRISTRYASSRAVLKDLSRGGAKLLTDEPIGHVDDLVELLLPFEEGEVSIIGNVLRTRDSEQGHFVAVAFTLIEPTLLRSFGELLERFLGQEGDGKPGRRQHSRVARRMEVRNGRYADLRALVTDLSRGGLAMTTAGPLDVGQEMLLALPDAVSGKELIFSACVAHKRRTEDAGLIKYEVGLEFRKIAADTRDRLDALLRHLL